MLLVVISVVADGSDRPGSRQRHDLKAVVMARVLGKRE